MLSFSLRYKKRHVQSSDLKMLQRRDYCLQKIVFLASWSVGWHSVTTFLSKDTKSLNDTSARAGQWWVMLPHRPPSDSSVSSSSSNSNGSWEGSATTSGNPALFQQLLIVVMLTLSQALAIIKTASLRLIAPTGLFSSKHCNILLIIVLR